jgi:ParB-like chromosome segregation protein Spo0J
MIWKIGYSPFDEVLNSRSDPITLDVTSKPYEIIDGRHRIFLARQYGYSEVPAQIFLSEERVEKIIINKARKFML